MKKGQKRLTSQEIEEIRRLYCGGYSSNQIGKKLKRCHTTILYHVGKLKRKPGSNQIIKTNPLEIPEFIRKNLAGKKAEKIKPERKEGYCMVCGKKIKDKRWRLTNYCGISCFGEKII